MSYWICVINLLSCGLWQMGKSMCFKGRAVKSDNVTHTGHIQVLSGEDAPYPESLFAGL